MLLFCYHPINSVFFGGEHPTSNQKPPAAAAVTRSPPKKCQTSKFGRPLLKASAEIPWDGQMWMDGQHEFVPKLGPSFWAIYDHNWSYESYGNHCCLLLEKCGENLSSTGIVHCTVTWPDDQMVELSMTRSWHSQFWLTLLYKNCWLICRFSGFFSSEHDNCFSCASFFFSWSCRLSSLQTLSPSSACRCPFFPTKMDHCKNFHANMPGVLGNLKFLDKEVLEPERSPKVGHPAPWRLFFVCHIEKAMNFHGYFREMWTKSLPFYVTKSPENLTARWWATSLNHRTAPLPWRCVQWPESSLAKWIWRWINVHHSPCVIACISIFAALIHWWRLSISGWYILDIYCES